MNVPLRGFIIKENLIVYSTGEHAATLCTVHGFVAKLATFILFLHHKIWSYMVQLSIKMYNMS